MSNQTPMFYFGPWDRAGHYYHDEQGYSIPKLPPDFPWREFEADGGLQPHIKGCFGQLQGNRNREHYECQEAPQGIALLHHRDGWTALAFWDRSIDKRGACNSTYFARGEFSFDEIVAMAKERFAYRWNKMGFPVVLFEASA